MGQLLRAPLPRHARHTLYGTLAATEMCIRDRGYAVPEAKEEDSSQFDVSDWRTLDEVVSWLLDLGRSEEHTSELQSQR